MAKKKAKAKKPTINALKKQVKLLTADLEAQASNWQIRLARQEEIGKAKMAEAIKDDAEHLKARTELIKALSWAMKTCSSVAWSEKALPWDFNKLRR